MAYIDVLITCEVLRRHSHARTGLHLCRCKFHFVTRADEVASSVAA